MSLSTGINVMPGGPVIAHTGTRLRLVPPEGWFWFTLDVHRVPPSKNNNAIRSNWRGFQTHKKSWQDEIEKLLMQQAVLRRHYHRAIAGAWMRFETRASRRDSPNFSDLINKALGDALVNASIIPDDDDMHFYFTGAEFEGVTGSDRTLFVIALQPPPS